MSATLQLVNDMYLAARRQTKIRRLTGITLSWALASNLTVLQVREAITSDIRRDTIRLLLAIYADVPGADDDMWQAVSNELLRLEEAS